MKPSKQFTIDTRFMSSKNNYLQTINSALKKRKLVFSRGFSSSLKELPPVAKNNDTKKEQKRGYKEYVPKHPFPIRTFHYPFYF